MGTETPPNYSCPSVTVDEKPFQQHGISFHRPSVEAPPVTGFGEFFLGEGPFKWVSVRRQCTAGARGKG